VKPRSTRVRLAALAAVALSIALGVAASPAKAGLGVACPVPYFQTFNPWGDDAFYAYAPNGGLESGSAGWTLSGGAAVVPGSESFSVHGTDDGYSLSLPAGSSATTPPMCIGLFSGKMRLFTSNAGASSSRLRVQVIYGGGTGSLLGLVSKTLGLADVATLTSGSDWQPSAGVPMLGGQLPLLTQYVQFRFTPADASGSWRIDDVYLDPLRYL
jgi:hypothetical protein